MRTWKRIVCFFCFLGIVSGCGSMDSGMNIELETETAVNPLQNVEVASLETYRLSRTEIALAWSDESDEFAEQYIVAKRAVTDETDEEEWELLAVLPRDQKAEGEHWQYIDYLESEEPQQYEYRIEIELLDSERFTTGEGKAVLGSNVKVCIDPGHYHVAKEVAEADEYHYIEGDFVLEMALELKAVLKEKYGIDACMTRETDSITLDGFTDEELDRAHIGLRGKYALEEDCDLFVSLHTNSNEENANGYPTYFQPISINKPLIIINQTALASDTALQTANEVGANLAQATFDMGLSETALFQKVSGGAVLEWTKELNDGLEKEGTVVCRTGKSGDYYGVLRGATEAGIPGMIIEHGYHSIQEVRKAAAEGNLQKVWAKADAEGIAKGFGF